MERGEIMDYNTAQHNSHSSSYKSTKVATNYIDARSLRDLSNNFDLRIHQLSRYIKDVMQDEQLSKDILKTANGLSLHIKQSQNAPSKDDKLELLQKASDEAKFTHEMINNLKDTQLVHSKSINRLLDDCNQINETIEEILVKYKVVS